MTDATHNTALRDRPPILAFVLLFTAMLAVVVAMAAIHEVLIQAEQAPSEARPESQSHPFHSNRQEKAT